MAEALLINPANPRRRKRRRTSRRRTPPRSKRTGRFLKRAAASRRRKRRNPQLAIVNPKRRKRRTYTMAKRKRRTSRRRTYRRRRNPARSRTLGLRKLTQPETFRLVGWGTAGAILARMVPGLMPFTRQWDQGWSGYLLNGITAVTLGGLARGFVGVKAAQYLITGGLIATGIRMAAELSGGRFGVGDYVLEGGTGEYVPERGEISGSDYGMLGAAPGTMAQYAEESNAF